MTVGMYLKEKRKQLGLSLREASQLTGVSHGHISDIEHDSFKPSFEKIMNILKVYNVDVIDFLINTGYLSSKLKAPEGSGITYVMVIGWDDVLSFVSGKIVDNKDTEYVKADFESDSLFALRINFIPKVIEFHNDDVIIICYKADAKPNDYVIYSYEGVVSLAQLKKYGNIYVLQSLNPKCKDIEMRSYDKNIIIGKVMEKKKLY